MGKAYTCGDLVNGLNFLKGILPPIEELPYIIFSLRGMHLVDEVDECGIPSSTSGKMFVYIFIMSSFLKSFPVCGCWKHLS